MKKIQAKFSLRLLLIYVSAALIFISAVVYFLPIITHTEPFSLTKTQFSGYDFTRALLSSEQSAKMFATQNLFEIQNVKTMAYVIAYGAPICFVYSIVLFVLTMLSTYKKKFNNIFAVGGYFLVWVILLIAVISVVSNMAVTRGEVTINNYSISFGIIVGVLTVLGASAINVVAVYIE